MNDTDGWTPLVTCANGFEADMLQQQLEAQGIPVLTDSARAGIFGASYQGGVPGGITLHVPASALEDARAIVGSGNDDDEDAGDGDAGDDAAGGDDFMEPTA